MGGLCGEVRLSLWLHAAGKSYDILSVQWPLDPKTYLPSWVNSDWTTQSFLDILINLVMIPCHLLGMCQRSRIEISERELNGTCNSTCTNKSYFGPTKQGCTRIDNCNKKETGWKRFFAQCVPCICDCALSCHESFPRRAVKHRWTSWSVMWMCLCKESVCVCLSLASAVKHMEKILKSTVQGDPNEEEIHSLYNITWFLLLYPIGWTNQRFNIWMFEDYIVIFHTQWR